MNCRSCGLDNVDGAMFCERCGSTFARSSDPIATSLSSPSGLFRTAPAEATSPMLPRSLTAEFRSFPLESPELSIPTPVQVERIDFDTVSVAPLEKQTAPGGPRAADDKQPFSPLRPSETLWIIDGVLSHLFEDEQATIPDRRFLHVKLMEKDEELYYHTYSADYWDRFEPMLVQPRSDRRVSIFHRPTDIVPGFPFMNFGVELELGPGAGEDAPEDCLRIAFRMKHYYSGRPEELLEGLRYTKPLQLALSILNEVSTRVGRPVPRTSSLTTVLELIAASKSDLAERVLHQVEELRKAAERQRVPLATELYSIILGLRFEAGQTRVMVADDLGFVSSLLQTARTEMSSAQAHFKYKRVTPRMGILLRSHPAE